MRVKYNSATITKNFSTAGGSEAEWNDFWASVFNKLLEMGAPLNPITLNVYGSGAICSFADDNDLVSDGGAGIGMRASTYGTSSNTTIGLDVYGYGRDPIGSFGNAFFANEYINFGKVSTLNSVGITIHSIKSGDSFYFGIVTSAAPAALASINFAITKMRRLSDPSADVGYAMVSGVAPIYGRFNNYPYMGKTLQPIEGFNYNNGYYNLHVPAFVGNMPEVESGKILLLPIYSGLEDVYYENVYLSAMQLSGQSEKAFETDRGSFLISVGNVMFNAVDTCTMVFDITEALSS